MKWAGPIIFVGFLSLGASMILQLLVALNVTYIKGIYFLDVNLVDGRQLRYGIWSNCVKAASGGSFSCTPHALGYPQQRFLSTVSENFVNNMAYALVISPIAAGFVGLAAGGAFLHLCSNTLLWPFLSAFATLLTAGTLGVDLAFFILARNSYNDDSSNQSVFGSRVDKASLGPAIWMQVAALPPAFFALVMLGLGYYLKKQSKREIRDDYYDFEPHQPTASNGNGRYSSTATRYNRDHDLNDGDQYHEARDYQDEDLQMQEYPSESNQRDSRAEASENSRTDLRSPTEARSTRYSVRGAY